LLRTTWRPMDEMEPGKLGRDREKLLLASHELLQTITKLRSTWSNPEALLAFSFVIAVWLAAVDSVALGYASPVWFGAGFMAFQIVVLRYFFPSLARRDAIQLKPAHILIPCGLTYFFISEYIFDMKHLASPTRSGIVLQHLPTYLGLMAAANFNEAAITLGVLVALVFPLAETWWQFNNFASHCCCICFGAWVKTQFLDFVQKCEALLEVRDAILEVTISEKEEELKDLDTVVKEKEESNGILAKELRQLKKQYSEMSTIAEEAVSMITGERHHGRIG